MTFADWFRPRIDRSLHWQQALALATGVLILFGPVSIWWRYEVQPKAGAREAVERSPGPESGFRTAEIFNELDRHADLLPVRTYADTNQMKAVARRSPTGGVNEAGPPNP